MTKEDIIRMAREAGWTSYDSQDERFERFAALVAQRVLAGSYPEMIALVAAAEREACAKVCEGRDFVPGGHEFTPQQLTKNLTDTIATQIRARSNT